MLRAHNLHIRRGRKTVLSEVSPCSLNRVKCSVCSGRMVPEKVRCSALCAVN